MDPQIAGVLVIGDDPVTRVVVCAVLESAGHTAIEAADGHSGLTAFYQHSPDLVVTDILMPGRDGIETIRELRGGNPEIRIIALSGDARFADPVFLRQRICSERTK